MLQEMGNVPSYSLKHSSRPRRAPQDLDSIRAMVG